MTTSMTTLPIVRPGPFINYSNQAFNTQNPTISPQKKVFVNDPSINNGAPAFDYIDPVNGACDSSEYWEWKYYLKQQKYNFTYGGNIVLETSDERYHTFENRKATDTAVSVTKKLEDPDLVIFDAGWSYVAPLPLEWELTYKCKNNGTLNLHSCFAKYQYPGLTPEDGYIAVFDPDNGEINEINRRVVVTLPASVFPRRVSMRLHANVGEDINSGAEIEFTWRFGPVGSFQD